MPSCIDNTSFLPNACTMRRWQAFFELFFDSKYMVQHCQHVQVSNRTLIIDAAVFRVYLKLTIASGNIAFK